MKATCTWGDGPPVSLTLEGTTMILHDNPINLDKWTNGTVSHGSIDLTVEEARKLASELLMAAQVVDELEQQCKDHDEIVGMTYPPEMEMRFGEDAKYPLE